jgi:hypothetical protein
MQQTFLHWANEPPSIRLYLVILLVMFCLSAWRLAKVLYCLHLAPNRRTVSAQSIREGVISPQEISQCVLAGKFLAGAPTLDQPNPTTRKQSSGQTDAVQLVKVAEDKFLELCEVSCQRVNSIRRYVTQTLLISFLLLALRSRGLVLGDYQVGHSTVPGLLLFEEAAAELLSALTLGFLLCVVLYGIWDNLDTKMAMRKAKGLCFFRYLRQELSTDA